jgi:hypothetical protein
MRYCCDTMTIPRSFLSHRTTLAVIGVAVALLLGGKSLVLFLFFGVVPGQHTVIAPLYMLLFYGLILSIIGSVILRRAYQQSKRKRHWRYLSRYHQRLPKRRYSHAKS